MTTAVQRRRGTTTEHASFTGLEGEISVNTTKETLVVHDGATVGGFELARADGSNFVATSVDINGGTIDGTTIGASSASTGAFTTLTASGEITANGGIALGDNDKATFGASDDLQIYHDGSSSYVEDAGSGNLILKSNGANIQFRDTSDNIIFKAAPNATTLYYAASQKLATTNTGIDVTGEITADGLVIDDGGALIKDAGADAILTLQRTGSVTSGAKGAVGWKDSSGLYVSSIQTATNGADNAGSLYFRTDNDSTGNTSPYNPLLRMAISSNGDISFYEDTGTTAKFFWDASAESLTVGGDDSTTATSLNTLVLGEYADASSGAVLRSSAASAINFEDSNASTAGRIYYNHTSDYMAFNTATSERMRLDDSGNLLIGQTDIPTGLGASNTKLIMGSFEDAPEFVAYNSDNAIEAGDKIGAYLFGNDDNNATEDHFAGMWAKSAGTTGAMDIHFAAGKSNYEDDSPHMTLDSSGNLLVGTTSDLTDAYLQGGGVGIALRSNDQLAVSRSGSTVAQFNRNTNDGDIVSFRKGGTTVGSIGTQNGTDFYITGSSAIATGLRFQTNEIVPVNGSAGNVDAAIDLGKSNIRFKDLYLSGRSYLGDGTNAAPAYTFGSDTNTGIYRAGEGSIGISINGTNRLNINSTDVFANHVLVAAGQIHCGTGSGRVSLTQNDGKGNANLCFNHASGIPDSNGSACRIETSVDGSTGSFSFEIGNSVTAGVGVDLTPVMRMQTSFMEAFTQFHLGDNIKAKFGNSQDLEIFHGSGNSFLSNNVGTLYIDQETNDGNIIVRNDNGSGGLAEYIVVDGGSGSVLLKHYGSTKLQTTSTGTSITGDIVATGNISQTSGSIYAFGNVEAGLGHVKASTGYLIDTTTVIDSSRNLTNIGNIDATGTLTNVGNISSSTNGRNSTGGNITLGREDASTTKESSIVSRQYSSQTETEGFTMMGSYADINTQYLFIGGGLAEQNSASTISLYTSVSGTTERTGTERVRVSISGLDIRSGDLKINGTTAIDSSRNISAGTITTTGNITTPDRIVHSGDSNTYIQFHAADQWRVVTGGAERFEVNNAAVKVAGELTVIGDVTSTELNMAAGGVQSNAKITQPYAAGNIGMYSASSSNNWYLGYATTPTLFGDGTKTTFNKRAYVNGLTTLTAATPNIISRAQTQDNGVTQYHIHFENSVGAVHGRITTNNFSTTYATTSDYRVKEDVQPMVSATERLLQLNPVNFRWKESDVRTDGFLAHEVDEIVPEAVVGEKDATEVKIDTVENEDGTTTELESTIDSLQALDQAKLIPLLVKTIQELEARITALENA